MWPDVDAGLAEIRHALAPGGRVLIGWHGGHDPRGHQRQLVLGQDRLDEITSKLDRHFTAVHSSLLQHSVIWIATTRT